MDDVDDGFSGVLDSKFGLIEWEINLKDSWYQVTLNIEIDDRNTWIEIDNNGFYFRSNSPAGYFGQISTEPELLKEMHDCWRKFLAAQTPEWQKHLEFKRREWELNAINKQIKLYEEKLVESKKQREAFDKKYGK